MKLKYKTPYWLYSLSSKLNDAKWWVLHRVHPKYRYHIHKYHRLAPGWHDVDYRMLHACFDLFTEFVEKEKGLETLKAQFTFAERDGVFCIEEAEGSMDYEGYLFAKQIYAEAKELYEWWNSKTETEINDLEFNPADKSELCTEQLIRLIKIRKYLWT